MNSELIKEKLFEQSKVYQSIKKGDYSEVQYIEQYDKVWGKSDRNYLNRKRLTYYLLYAHVDDENTVVYLFQEELKDRKSNSFQGIGNTLNVLTSILNKFNVAGKYDGILDEAKNANFDCACGFDKNYKIDNEISSLDLMDCIFLSQDLDYKDVMEVLVNSWKKSVTKWTDANRKTLIGFNSFLGKELENKEIYETLLGNAIASGKTFEIVSAYNDVIRYYIDSKNIENAYFYIKRMIDATDFKEIERIRLFAEVLEECFDIICGDARNSLELWQWGKPYLSKRTNMYGNLYTKGIAAAKCVNDPYSEKLEQEYKDWKKRVGI
ncbi:MAG: hypothetical protein IJA10_04120 [Lachnospiraceae bacterium]|nr:hypothetical protein [Lachnospiraceae bacterium]